MAGFVEYWNILKSCGLSSWVSSILKLSITFLLITVTTSTILCSGLRIRLIPNVVMPPIVVIHIYIAAIIERIERKEGEDRFHSSSFNGKDQSLLAEKSTCILLHYV